jgi:hypothetical protein
MKVQILRALTGTLVQLPFLESTVRFRKMVQSKVGRGRSCVIVGNAANLSVADFPFRHSFDTVVVNSFMSKPLAGVSPTYWISTDRVFLRRDGPAAIREATRQGVIPLLPATSLLENGADYLRAVSKAALFPNVRVQPLELSGEVVDKRFPPRSEVPLLKTVTATAICVCSELGYEKIALVGCDAYGQVIQGADANIHYYGDAAKSLSEYDARRLSLSHRASYLFAARFAHARGTRVLNYSSTTAVEEIPRSSGVWA